MSRSVVRGAKHMGTKSTVKGGARVGKAPGSRLAYDAVKHNKPNIKSTQKMRMPQSKAMAHHLQQQARTPGLRARQPMAQKPGWAHGQLV